MRLWAGLIAGGQGREELITVSGPGVSHGVFWRAWGWNTAEVRMLSLG